MSVRSLTAQANKRDKQTAAEERTLTKNHKQHVTNAPTPSRQDVNFKNTRVEVGPTAGDKTIAPKPVATSPRGAKSTSSNSAKKSSGLFGGAGGGATKKFCANCGTPRGAGAFCSNCGERL